MAMRLIGFYDYNQFAISTCVASVGKLIAEDFL